jgi:uncharacterized membrane protein YcaP (DUF421 family)
MNHISDVQWHDIFVPDTPLLEIFIRGSLVYLIILVLLRLFSKQSGAIGIADLLVLVLIADASQNAMAANYNSLTDGVFLIATLIFWSLAADWLSFRFPRIRQFTYPNPVMLVKDGKVIKEHLQREYITDEELMTQVRLQGLEDLARVKASYLEGDGHISVIEVPEKHHGQVERPGV